MAHEQPAIARVTQKDEHRKQVRQPQARVRQYDLNAPLGVMGRNSDNERIREYLCWEPSILLRTGMEKTYAWIYDQFMAADSGQAALLAETTR